MFDKMKLAAVAPGFVSANDKAETIYYNGSIYTVDDARSWAQAMAVSDGEIVAVGLEQDILALKGNDTAMVDLGARMVMPGIVDGK